MSEWLIRQSGRQRVAQIHADNNRQEKTIEFTSCHPPRERRGSFDAGFSTAC